MAKHIYDIKIDGVDYVVASDTELSDGQAYQAALAQHSAVQPVDKDEPTTYGGGFAKGWNEGSRAGLRGFLPGVPQGAMNFVKGIVPGVIGATSAALKG